MECVVLLCIRYFMKITTYVTVTRYRGMIAVMLELDPMCAILFRK